MTLRSSSIDAGLGIGFIVSAVIHLTVFLLVTQGAALFPVAPLAQQVAYVDLVNLPVENPLAQPGVEQPLAADETVPQEGPESGASQQSPAVSPSRAVKPEVTTPSAAASSDDSEFAERLSRLTDKQESRRQQAVLDSLRTKQQQARSTVAVASSGKKGETGSDYTAYIQSRLKDAFRGTIKYSTKTPFVTIRLFIGTDGALQRHTIVASSGDQELERAALDAVELAKEHFTPPPTRLWYEGQFVFKPEGISRPGVSGR